MYTALVLCRVEALISEVLLWLSAHRAFCFPWDSICSRHSPVSLANIIGAETDTEEILHRVCSRIAERCEMLFHDIDNAKCADLHARYLDSLFRRDGALHPFALPDGTQIVRRIVDVAPDGRITLADDQGNSDQFYFKEIAFVI